MYLYLTNYMTKGLEIHEAATVQATVAALKAFRENGLEKGLGLLESHLDGALITFCCSPPLTKEGTRSLERARQYRKMYPFKSGDPNIDNFIEKALSEERK